MSSDLQSAGWYTDPDTSDGLRWWNGTAWTVTITPETAMGIIDRWSVTPTCDAASTALHAVESVLAPVDEVEPITADKKERSLVVTADSVRVATNPTPSATPLGWIDKPLALGTWVVLSVVETVSVVGLMVRWRW